MSQTETESVEDNGRADLKSATRGCREVDPEIPSRFRRVWFVQGLSKSPVLRDILRFLLEE